MQSDGVRAFLFCTILFVFFSISHVVDSCIRYSRSDSRDGVRWMRFQDPEWILDLGVIVIKGAASCRYP